LFTECELILFNAKSVWGSRFEGETSYRLKQPGRVEVKHPGAPSCILHRAILDNNPSFSFMPLSPSVRGSTNVNTAECFTTVPTIHFQPIMFYFKLRFLLKLHSALCELDNNYCSLQRIIQGMHTLGVQECERCICDNPFEVRRRKQLYDPTAVVDDILEQLERGLGKGFECFMNFVQSCDARKALMINKHDVHMARVSYNDKLEVMVEEIFLSWYCDFSMKTHRVSEILADIEAFSLPVPRIPMLKTNYVRAFMDATSGGSRGKREKGAQFEALHIACNLDLEELPLNLQNEIAEADAAGASQTTTAPNPNGLYRKKRLPLSIYDCLFSIIGHKFIFREGIRERLMGVIQMRYDLDEFLRMRLSDLGHINLDARLLTEDQMHRIVVQEKEKLCKWFDDYHQETLLFLQPSVVGVPREDKGDPRYWPDLPIPTYVKTLEDRTFIHAKPPTVSDKKPAFVVPNVNSPLTKDRNTLMLKTTGYFAREMGACI